MGTRLGDKLRQERERLGMTLRSVEDRTGVRNAHLSQIENGIIERPDPNILWSLSGLYELDFGQLMRLAGHTTASRGTPGSVFGVAYRALGELTSQEQSEVLRYIGELKQSRGRKTK